MKVKWLGHASFLITAQDGTKIITDPYEPGSVRGMITYDRIEEVADLVTVSHEHADHNYVAGLPGSPEVIRGVGTHRAKGIEFTGIGAFHDKSRGGERGPDTIFCFTVDGIRVCHLGDLGHELSQEQVAQVGPVDLLLIPVGGPGATLELDEATRVVARVNPRVVIPMHFKNDKCSFPRYGVEDFIAGKANVRKASASEVEFAKEQLPQATETVVLDHAL